MPRPSSRPFSCQVRHAWGERLRWNLLSCIREGKSSRCLPGPGVRERPSSCVASALPEEASFARLSNKATPVVLGTMRHGTALAAPSLDPSCKALSFRPALKKSLQTRSELATCDLCRHVHRQRNAHVTSCHFMSALRPCTSTVSPSSRKSDGHTFCPTSHFTQSWGLQGAQNGSAHSVRYAF